MNVSKRIVLFFGAATWKQFLQLAAACVGLVILINVTRWVIRPHRGVEILEPICLGLIATLWLIWAWHDLIVPITDQIYTRLKTENDHE